MAGYLNGERSGAEFGLGGAEESRGRS